MCDSRNFVPGCANIKLQVFENTNNFHDYVSAFNVQTNLWVFQYVYKRLKFLNNKNISHLSTLLFLAIWHGFHSGYYMTFFMEFMLINFEKGVSWLRHLGCADRGHHSNFYFFR